MAIRMDHHLDEIGIVERGRRAVPGGVVEPPGGRPGLPEEAADLAPLLLKAPAAALRVEIPLIPAGALLGRGGGRRRRHRVLHVVAADGDKRAHALGRHDGGDAGRAPAPVIAREGDLRQSERLHEVE